jgi:hypothetical protein
MSASHPMRMRPQPLDGWPEFVGYPERRKPAYSAAADVCIISIL